MDDTYRTIQGPCEGMFKAKGSKHLGYGFPIASEEDVKRHLEDLKKAHHAARHVAYAWMLGHDGTLCRASDDGEPNNSAGPPILGVIRAHNLTHVLFAVVRYFGGTKLGVGGLIEAYREGASAALSQGKIVERIRTQRLRISFAYEHMGVVMGIVKRFELEPASTDFQWACCVDVDVRLSQIEAFANAIHDTRVAEVEQM